ncbi:MAG: hypothetical protein IID31_02965 [Planctomycetes bacterium]|nr:hypothetical protein [Planctomycetota bacterium]
MAFRLGRRAARMAVVVSCTLPAWAWRPALGQPEGVRADDRMVHATLVSEHQTVRPGERAWLGIRMQIEPGWHVYFDGLNDTGMPMQVRWDTDDDVKIGAMVWPAPRREVTAEFILDHVYEGDALVLVPVDVPEDANPGDEIRVQGRLRWMVCKDICLLEQGEVSIVLPVGEPGLERTKTGQAVLFAQARSRLPESETDTDSDIEIELAGSTLRVRAAQAEYLAFYPAADCAAPRDLIREGESKSGEIVVHFEESRPRVRGLIEVRRGGATRIHRVTIPIEDAKSVEDGSAVDPPRQR